MISIEESNILLQHLHLSVGQIDKWRTKWQEAGLVEKPPLNNMEMARKLRDSIMNDKLVSSGQGSRQLLADGLQGKAFQMADWYEKHITSLEKELEKSRVKE